MFMGHQPVLLCDASTQWYIDPAYGRYPSDLWPTTIAFPRMSQGHRTLVL
jgi:hypothetical protein